MMRVAASILLLSLMLGVAKADAPPPEARARYVACKKAFNEGEFQRAVDECKASYEAYPAPLLLFSIAQAYRRLPNPEKALHYYRQYLAESPRGKERKNVEEQIAQLEKLIAEQQHSQAAPPHGIAPAVEPPPPEPAPIAKQQANQSPAPGRWYRNPIGWGVAGAGLGLCVVGAGLLGAIPGIEADARNARDLNGERSQENRADTFQSAGWAMVGIGAAAIVAGAVVLAVSAKRDPRRASLTVTPIPSGAALSLGGSW